MHTTAPFVLATSCLWVAALGCGEAPPPASTGVGEAAEAPGAPKPDAGDPAKAARTPVELPPTPDDPAAVQVVRFLGPEITAILTAVTRVESFRIAGRRGDGATGFHGYPITATGPDLSPDQIATVRRALLDAKSYDFESMKKCMPTPGVALRFHAPPAAEGQPARQFGLTLCFECSMWEFFHGDRTFDEDFDGARGELVAIAKALFPNDAVIQGLK